MNKSMKAAAITQWGDAGVFQLIQIPVPAPAADEVLVKVAYAGVNPADWKMRAGYLKSQLPATDAPLVLGLDASGVVVATGEQVSEFAEGDRVACASNLFSTGAPGAYAEYLVVSKNKVARLPDTVSLQAAATLPIAAITAKQALFAGDKGNLQPGENVKVLINGASGGVGSFAVQLAKWAGAEVATSCSSANLDYIKSLGADCLIDYKTQDIAHELRRWAPQGVDLLLDAISAGSLEDPFALLKPGGKLVSIATLTDDGDVEADMARAQQRGVSKILAFVSDANLGKEMAQLLELVSTGKMTVPATEVFPLDKVVQAHQKLETGHVRGKLLLRLCAELQ
ncbi:NADP-dependent oxidoreductase [Thalassomonas actiniarum]|uniref:NADP-dependent oxidoreductase n=1 Tax=Thalassomonas actiniarum TaxID=485447 RepID=A0AAE9YRE1_9GAMM|nr:NADP-dependent oxidoreductase [Thalassomonas actiniarum]WDD99815.1 NADP-dependent oxidoreductase [Thalassomonas actiniarum]